MLVHSKEKFFFFTSVYSLHGMTFGIWVSYISQIMSLFSMNKRQLFMCLHLSTSKRQLIMCLHPLMNKWQLTSHTQTLCVYCTLVQISIGLNGFAILFLHQFISKLKFYSYLYMKENSAKIFIIQKYILEYIFSLTFK